jgi:tRNA pseudouridine32 synthase / 23S rRNA pseudouridine746 synthase
VQDYSPPPDHGLALIYQDDSLLVLDKPGGLLSVPGRGAGKQDCLLTRVRKRFADAECVHRLDMETSGLMLVARGKPAQRTLSRLFEQRLVYKHYIAMVQGRVTPMAGEIHLPLICDWPNRPRQRVDHAAGKPSTTRYRVLHHDRASNTTRVALQPLTGRSHQLRVHMLSLGHSILGDSLYATAGTETPPSRLMLHATALAFRHPLSGRASHFFSRAPF